MSIQNKKIEREIRKFQTAEITEYYIYSFIAKRVKNESNKQILLRIASQEKAHYEMWSNYLGYTSKPNHFKIIYYSILSIIFGYTFTLKILEKGEDNAKKTYEDIIPIVPMAAKIAMEEDEHEKELINLLDEERLSYIGSMVLGLNDALVELSGTLAGLSFALSDTRLISLSGLITGIAASLSMAASEYLSAKADNRPDALKSSLYTGSAYVMTVTVLILPYLLISNPMISLAIMLSSVVLIIFLFNFYISVAKDLPFKKRFSQMAIISLSVAVISFGIGLLVKSLLGIDL